MHSQIILLSSALPAFAASTTKSSIPSNPTTQLTTTPSSNSTTATGQYQQKGVKKWLVVQALKYGGPLLGEMVESLSPEAGAALTEYAYTLGVELSYLTEGIEASLIKFMNIDLGLPLAMSRSIAWLICFFAI